MTLTNNSTETHKEALNKTPVDVQPTQSAVPNPRLILARRLVLAASALLVILVAIGLIAWRNLPPELHGIQLESPRVAEDFTLPTSTGETMSLSDFRGKYVVVFFGYTYCPDACPTTLNDLQQMTKAMTPEQVENTQVVMISVDPERDTPQQLATYLDYFDPNFIGMTGTVQEIQPIASQFGIFFERQPGSENTGYLVDHSSAVTLIDPEGRVRMIFTYGTKGEDMASDLSYLMRRG